MAHQNQDTANIQMKNSSNQVQLQVDPKVHRVLRRMGLVHGHKLCTTLQGGIWRAQYSKEPTKTAVIKVTDRSLHDESKCVVDGATYNVYENIVSEQRILRHLSHLKDAPQSMVQFKEFHTSHSMYFLVMEDGGNSLFQFVSDSHHLLSQGLIDITEWHKVVTIIWQQMVECLQFIHSNNVCHSDISLENFVISDVEIEVPNVRNKSKTPTPFRFIPESISVKLCDFGLAQQFENDQCLSNKHCGKRAYKSPEVINEKEGYSAKKNDSWGLGVCLFMMMVGCPPFHFASASDPLFVCMMNGGMMEVIKAWGKEPYIDSHLMALVEAIFKYEQNRVDLTELLKLMDK